jgi:hypothetical protein
MDFTIFITGRSTVNCGAVAEAHDVDVDNGNLDCRRKDGPQSTKDFLLEGRKKATSARKKRQTTNKNNDIVIVFVTVRTSGENLE